MSSQVIFFTLAFVVASTLANTQRLSVKGNVFCPPEPDRAVNITIRVYDKDILKDDRIGKGTTNATGDFAFDCVGSELTTVDPELRIYHKCGASFGTVRYYEWKYEIPDRYINSDLVFNLGSVNLELDMDEFEESKELFP